MKRIFTLLLFIVFCGGSAMAYSFSAVCSSGQTLYYNITSDTVPYTVEVTSENASSPYYSTYPTGELEIPESIEYNSITYSVTSIGNYAFYGCSGLTSVTIPNSVTSIGNYAFYNCSGLTSVTIPDYVTIIGGYAFSGCSGLTGILTIPDSVINIGGSAFAGCTGLITITIGSSVTNIGTLALSDLNALTTVNFNATNCTRMGTSSSVFVTTVFSSCPLFATLNIGENVTNIPRDAFKNCGALKTVNYNAINCSPFSNNSNNGITGNTNITTINIGENVESIPDGAFSGCSGLTSVNFNAINCTSMGSQDALVFGGCYSLSNLNIGDNVTNIPDNAFKSCSGLNGNLILPNSLQNIGVSAFDGCSSLDSLILGNSIVSVGSYAFSGCSGFSSLTIPSTLNNISSNAFYNCGGLNSISVDPNNSTYDSRENCNAIIRTSDNTLLLGCNNAIIPESVTSIEAAAFYNCNALHDVNIHKYISSIGDDAFYGCTSISEMVVKAISLNSNFTRSPFGPEGNTLLKKVSIDTAVTRLPDYMFAGCSAIDSIMVYTMVPPSVYANTFEYANLSNKTVVVPCGTISTYEAADFWYNFRRIQQSASCPVPYTITVLTSNPNYGVVTGGGEYLENTTAILTATPYEECMFVNWNDGNTENPREITVTEDATYIATFVRGNINPTVFAEVDTTACGSYTWNDITYTESGDYEQIFTATNSADSIVTLHLTIYPLPQPEITVDGILDACNPETTSVMLSTGEYDSYMWSNGETAESAVVTTPGSYYVEAVDENGCHGFSEEVTIGYSTILTEAPQIKNAGMNDNGFNVIGWRVTQTEGIASFEIYRENNASDVFSLVGVVTRPGARTYIDSTANPSARAYRYKICAVDACGGMSPMSEPHKTMHLTINQGIGNDWNLIWSHYEGLDIRSYKIYRGTTKANMVVIGEVPSSQNSFTDSSNPYNIGFFYKVMIVKNTRSNDDDEDDEMLSSNIVDNGYVVTHNVIVASSNPAYGSVNGGGVYANGTEIVIGATANAGYEFSAWNDGSTVNPRSVTITSDTLFIANFVEISQAATYNITVYSSNQEYGTVTGGGTYAEGTEITLTATANSGYEFVSWSDGSRVNPHTITVTEDAVYIATFVEASSVTNYTIAVISSNPTQGSVTGGGTYPEGSVISIEAVANDGYQFVSWNDNCTDNPRSITVVGDAMYIATFVPETDISETSLLEISVFPNPATDILNITSSEEISSVEIVNDMGQIVLQADVNADNVVCDVKGLTAGVYIVRIHGTDTAIICQRKFIKE